ncbi:MAG: DotG/IcmE/VirB10 family protein [Rhodocyclaceae bacterium]|nr:DotG/IcmE/VirB10 family protein [Rhodocyclaceae bacterium]
MAFYLRRPIFEENDAERMQRIMQGMQAQMARIVQAHMPPATISAARYQDERQQGQPAAQTTPAAAQQAQAPTQGAPSMELVPALTLVAAELLSPIDTDKTAFVSAKIASGPMAGGTLYGAAEMVRDQGVRVRFNRMLAPNGRSYTINAIAMDPASAHDTLAANIDRKLLERYVLPFIGAVAGGYLDAVAQVQQQVTIADGGAVVVQQPEVKAKQAAARGLAAGVNQAVAEASKSRGAPSASLPAGTPIGILFLDAVLSSATTQGAAAVANWTPSARASTH